MEHDHSSLAAYALGALDPDEARAVDSHVAGCAECRAELAEFAAMEAALGEVPPEAFLDGPPDGDLMLQRTLRQVRTERVRTTRPRRLALAAAAVALAGASLAGGALIGRSTAPSVEAGPQPSVSATVSTPAGTRAIAGKDPRTGASLTGSVIPAAGWVRVHVKVEGVRAGLRCRLVVVSRTGAPVEAGSWLVSPLGERQGITLDGSALVAPNDVASIDVETIDGRKLVSVAV